MPDGKQVIVRDVRWDNEAHALTLIGDNMGDFTEPLTGTYIYDRKHAIAWSVNTTSGSTPQETQPYLITYGPAKQYRGKLPKTPGIVINDRYEIYNDTLIKHLAPNYVQRLNTQRRNRMQNGQPALPTITKEYERIINFRIIDNPNSFFNWINITVYTYGEHDSDAAIMARIMTENHEDLWLTEQKYPDPVFTPKTFLATTATEARQQLHAWGSSYLIPATAEAYGHAWDPADHPAITITQAAPFSPKILPHIEHQVLPLLTDHNRIYHTNEDLTNEFMSNRWTYYGEDWTLFIIIDPNTNRAYSIFAGDD